MLNFNSYNTKYANDLAINGCCGFILVLVQLKNSLSCLVLELLQLLL